MVRISTPLHPPVGMKETKEVSKRDKQAIQQQCTFASGW
jgi:hypothetical protein